jgi:hypothetical protein
MAKKSTEGATDATNGTNEAAKPVLSIDDIRKALAELPAGAKEQAAWEKYGDGNLSRAKFRNLWLEIRVPKKDPAKPNEGVKK